MSEEIKEQIREDEEDEGINLLDYLIILAKHKKLIFLFTLFVAIISTIISLRSSISFYEAQISIFPTQKQEMSMANQFMSQFGLFRGRTGGSIHNNQRLFVEIIKSRTFTDRLMERFNIQEAYAAKNAELTRKLLLKKIIIEPDFTDEERFKLSRANPSPLMKITVIDQNPQKAADIANAIVDELNIFVNNIAISEVSQRRLFFEKQLRQINDSLITSEEEVKLFQEKTGILEVKAQTSIVIEKIARMQEQITAKEIELQVMQSYSTAGNPDVQRVSDTIKALKKELAKFEANENNSKILPTDTFPALGLEYKRIFRQLKFHETLYEIISKQYEAAKLDEAKDATLIQVIDKAVPPKKVSKMRTWGGRKALAVTMFAFLFSCGYAFIREFSVRSSKNRGQNYKLETLKSYLSFGRNK